MNDFEAMALGVPYVDPSQCYKLGGGTSVQNGNIGVVGPGTGLGVASLVWNKRGGYYIPVSGEGGHTTLAHKNDYEWALAKQVKADQGYSHVSFERMCSGKHLAYVYHAVCTKENIKPEPLQPEHITARAIDRSCKACVIAVDQMLGLLGCMAGNLALINSTFGGVYFCGGILPKLGMDFIKQSRLRHEFCAKGRYEAYLETIPTFVVDDDYMPLKGLQSHVASMLRDA
jgi:glucokinase